MWDGRHLGLGTNNEGIRCFPIGECAAMNVRQTIFLSKIQSFISCFRPFAFRPAR
jgi:hypothetical protein